MIDEKLVEKLANLPSLGYINRDGRNCHCSDCVAYRKAVIRDVLSALAGRGRTEPQSIVHCNALKVGTEELGDCHVCDFVFPASWPDEKTLRSYDWNGVNCQECLKHKPQPSPEPTKKFPLRLLVALDEEGTLFFKDADYDSILDAGWRFDNKYYDFCALLGLSREEGLARIYENTGAKLVGDDKWEIEQPEPPQPLKTYSITELEAVLRGHPELVAWRRGLGYAAIAQGSRIVWIVRDGQELWGSAQAVNWDDLRARYTIMSLEDWKAGKT